MLYVREQRSGEDRRHISILSSSKTAVFRQVLVTQSLVSSQLASSLDITASRTGSQVFQLNHWRCLTCPIIFSRAAALNTSESPLKWAVVRCLTYCGISSWGSSSRWVMCSVLPNFGVASLNVIDWWRNGSTSFLQGPETCANCFRECGDSSSSYYPFFN